MWTHLHQQPDEITARLRHMRVESKCEQNSKTFPTLISLNVFLCLLTLIFPICPCCSQECPRLCAQAPCSPLPVASALIWPVLSLGRKRRPRRRARDRELAWLTGRPSPLPLWTPSSRIWCPPLTTIPRYGTLRPCTGHERRCQSPECCGENCVWVDGSTQQLL